MIEKNYGKFTLICDYCGEDNGEDFDAFQEAVDFKKANGWKSEKIGEDWFDWCGGCEK